MFGAVVVGGVAMSAYQRRKKAYMRSLWAPRDSGWDSLTADIPDVDGEAPGGVDAANANERPPEYLL